MINLLFFMKPVLQSPIYLKIKIYIDGIFSIASIFCVPAVIVAGIVWWTGPASNLKVAAPNAEQISTEQGQVAKVEPRINMQVSGPKVVYRLQLVDHEGKVQYSYPETTIQDDKLTLDKVNVRVPDNLQPGEYSLVADVKYLGNPIQTNSMQLDLAHISVGTKTN